jgi:hypothetical protein
MPALGSVQVVAEIETPQAVEPCAYASQLHASPDPHEILHVPKPAV